MKRILLFALLSCFYGFVQAQPGTLDPTFADGGKLIDTAQLNNQENAPIAIQKDGKILMGGTGSYGNLRTFRITRLMPDGSLDPSFGQEGNAYAVFTQSAGAVFGAYLSALTLQSDGKIIAAGGGPSIHIARFNTDGSLDSSFGTKGTVVTKVVADVTEYVYAILVQPDDKIVLGGMEEIVDVDGENGTGFFAIYRTLPNGAPDESFGERGKMVSEKGLSISSLALQEDGKIIAGGDRGLGLNSGFYIGRYLPDGTLDRTFGSEGSVETFFENQYCQLNGIALQPDGKLLATGQTLYKRYSDFLLARYDTNGALDRTFNDSGKVVTTFPKAGAEGISVVVQEDGKIIVAGNNIDDFPGGFSDFALACYNPDGSLNRMFGNEGIVTTDMGSDFDVVYAAALQPDGKLVVSGFQDGPSIRILARYNTTQSVLPLTFNKFTATQNEKGVVLNWQTAQETNTNYFSVQRSLSNSPYTEIGKVKSVGYSTEPHNYTYIDNNPAQGANLYQLKQVDKNGSAFYSKAAFVNYSSGNVLRLYPNPARSIVTVEGLKASESTTISLLDMNGKVVKQQVSAGSTKYTISIAPLASGTYYLKATAGNNTTTIKFVKE